MHFLYQQRKLERFILGFIDLWSKNTALQTAIDLGKPMSAFFQWISQSLTTCMYKLAKKCSHNCQQTSKISLKYHPKFEKKSVLIKDN